MTRRGLQAWLDGEPVIVIGNIVENAAGLYGPPHVDGAEAYWLDGSRRYAPIATSLATNAEAVILTEEVDERWRSDGSTTTWIAAGEVDVPLCEAIVTDDSLRRVVAGSDSPLFPWSPTSGFGALERSLRPDHAESDEAHETSVRAMRRADSKIGSNRIFDEVAADHPRVHVPGQTVVERPAALLDALRLARAERRDVFAKAEFGQAGYGSVRIDASDGRDLAELIEHLAASDPRFRSGCVAVEERIDSHPDIGEITVDAMVLGPGEVVVFDAAHMHIRGTHYVGVAVGPGVLDDELRRAAMDFTDHVGTRLGADGYVGWYCVDFVHAPDGSLNPTEINPRCTGSTVAHAWRLTDIEVRDRQVRTIDAWGLPPGMVSEQALEWSRRMRSRTKSEIIVPPLARDPLVPTIGLMALNAP